MLIANTGQSLVVMNLRTGEQVQLPPGQMTPVLDSKIPLIDDSFVLISLFNAGVLVAYTDAGSAHPGFPTASSPSDSKRIPPVDGDYASALFKAGVSGRRPSAILKPIGGAATGASLSTTRTWRVWQSFVSRPIAARLIIGNQEATRAAAVKACICVSSTIGSAYGTVTDATWADFLWSGAASTQAPLRVSASLPGWLASDLLPIANAPKRSDGPGYLLVLHLVPGATGETFSYSITNGSASTPTDLDTTYFSQLPAGQVFKVRRADGDFGSAATANNFTGGTAQNNIPLFMLEVYCEDGSIVFLEGGDSLTAGERSEGGNASAIDKLCAELRSEGVEAHHINCGIPGSSTTTYSAYLRNIIPVVRAPIVVYAPWSPNDANAASPNLTQAIVDTMKRNAISVYETAVANGAELVVFRGAQPQDNIPTSAMDVLRTQMNQWILSLRWPRLITVDLNAVYGDGTSPENYLPGLSPDGLHPNGDGYAREKTQFRRTLAPILR